MPENASAPKVLYIIGQLGKGGAEKGLYLLLKHLPHEALIVSLSEGGYWAEPIRSLGYEVVELVRTQHGDFRRFWEVTRLIHAYQPDIVHLFGDTLSGLYGRIPALLNHHPHTIVSVRHHPSGDAAWHRLAKCGLDRHVKLFLTNSFATRDCLITKLKVPPAKVAFIANGIELDLFSSPDPDPITEALRETCRSKIVVGTVTKLTSIKAPEIFVRAARRVIQQAPEVIFVYVGDGPLYPQTETLCNELELGDSLRFLGQRDDVNSLLSSMDIFVLTSRSEGMPNSVMEAMAAGLPCIVTDAGDCRQLVRNGENGFVVPIGDDTQLAARILQLVEDKSLRRHMGEKSREYIRAFDVSEMVKKYNSAYKAVLVGK